MKKITIMACAVMGFLIISAGCSSVNELQSSINEVANSGDVTASGLNIIKNKTTKSELIKSIGAPGLVFKNDKGFESWVYQRVAVRSSDLNFSSSIDFAAVFPYSPNTLSSGAGLAGGGTGTSLSSSKSSYKTAGLLINFNKNGCVDTYEFTSTSF